MFYDVFGGVFQSEIEFPELVAIDARRPDWTLTRCSSLATLSGRVLLGEEELASGITARFERGTDRFRLSFDDTGTFDISTDGSRIEWAPSPDGDAALVRSDVSSNRRTKATFAGTPLLRSPRSPQHMPVLINALSRSAPTDTLSRRPRP